VDEQVKSVWVMQTGAFDGRVKGGQGKHAQRKKIGTAKLLETLEVQYSNICKKQQRSRDNEEEKANKRGIDQRIGREGGKNKNGKNSVHIVPVGFRLPN